MRSHTGQIFILLILAVSISTPSLAFSPAPILTGSQRNARGFHQTSATTTSLQMVGGTFELPERPDEGNSDDDDNHDDDSDDEDYEIPAAQIDPEVEAMRQRLMDSLQQEYNNNNNSNNNPTTDEYYDGSSNYVDNYDWQSELESLPPTPLTAIGRERMLKEISLLEDLMTSDNAVADLWDLWFSSRGSKVAEELSAIEGLVLMDEIVEAETKLRDIIDREGLDYVEPIHRLANLLMDAVEEEEGLDQEQEQRLLEEAKQLYELVLSIKPWHFGALTGMVQVCRRLGDEAGLQQHGSNLLPSLHSGSDNTNTARQQWVQRMVSAAHNILQQREQSNNDAFTECDMLAGCALDYDDGDAWQ